jgi:type II restriction/modification system DNA methylase subunit YeeA
MTPIRLNGQEVAEIYADLTAPVGAEPGTDLTLAKPLAENGLTAFNGIQKTGPFDISGEIARAWITLPANPNGLGNWEVVKPYWNGLDLTRRIRDMWIVDFGWEMSEADASLFEAPFEYALRQIKPVRDANSLEALRRDWWRLWRPRPEMRKKISALTRYIVTPEVSKHRLFGFLSLPTLPDKNLIVIARSDDVTFGILHSRFHELWALRMGTSLEDRPRYTPTTTFETFPFPAGLTPNLKPEDYANPHAEAIAQAARRLNELRENWLNPPEWVERVPEVVPGYPDRLIPKPGLEAELKKRTLTNLYNQRPAWLANAHQALDAAVAAAYGWPADLREEEILRRLLALNRERSA